jgi:hypothetical protein
MAKQASFALAFLMTGFRQLARHRTDGPLTADADHPGIVRAGVADQLGRAKCKQIRPTALFVLLTERGQSCVTGQ